MILLDEEIDWYERRPAEGLIQFMVANDLTAEDLSGLSGVPRDTISEILIGTYDPPFSTAVAIWFVCRATDPSIGLDELFLNMKIA